MARKQKSNQAVSSTGSSNKVLSNDNRLSTKTPTKNIAKDNFVSKLAFYISLGFWVPLFNIAICLTSLIFAYQALRRHMREPEKYGGVGYIIAAMIISISSILLTIIGLIFYLLSQDVCTRAICAPYMK